MSSMNKFNFNKSCVIVLIFTALIAPSKVSNAASLPVTKITSLQATADAVIANAKSYQWKRVGGEVVCITADEKSVEKAVKGDAALEANAEKLRKAVLALRSAQAAHDTDKTVAAAKSVYDECSSLLK